MIRFKCKNCGEMVDTADSLAGKTTKCPKCMHLLDVPKPLYVELRERAQGGKEPAESKPEAQENPDPYREFWGQDYNANIGESESKEYKLVDFHFDEASLFAMSFAFFMLVALDAGMRKGLHSFVSHLLGGSIYKKTAGIILILLPFAAGLVFSVYHSFSKRDKSFWEKSTMLFFAVTITAGAGLSAGLYILSRRCNFPLIIFVIWNLIYAVLLIGKFEYATIEDELDADYISDRNATIGQVIFAAATAGIVLLSCLYIFKLHWSITYSVCVAFTTSMDKGLQKVIGLKE